MTSHFSSNSSKFSLVPSISAGLVNGVLIIIFQSAYAALIFSGDLSEYVSRGIGFMLFGAFVMGIIVALTSSYHSTVTAPQDASTAIMALAASLISIEMAAYATREEMFITTVAAIILTSLVTGVLLTALGWFKLGNLIRFIPYPVIGGFLAGTGWILVKGAVRIMSNTKMALAHVYLLFQPDIFIKWIPGLGFAVILFFILRRTRHFSVMPLMIMAAIIIFYLTVFITNTTILQASADGWLLPRFSDGITWQPLLPADLSKADFSVIFHQSGSLATIVFVSLISLLLNASGLELIARKEIDLNRELRSTGLANFIAGFGGSSVGYMSLSLSALGHRIGARHRIAVFISAGLCGLVLLSGMGISSYFPKFLLGGLLFYLGLSFLVEWVYRSWYRLPKIEYFLVILILLTIAFFGLLEGMIVGVLIAVMLFVVNYSRISVVKNMLSGTTYQSNVQRAAQFQRLLKEKGEQLYILQLQGYIFFGTANDLLEEIKRRINDEAQIPLRYVVLDFRLVSGLDSSALNSFAKMKLLEETMDITIVFTGLTLPVYQQFEKGELVSAQDSLFLIFPDLDHGVEWCEDQILRAEALSAEQPSENADSLNFFKSFFNLSITNSETDEKENSTAHRIFYYLEKLDIAEGEHLIRQGAPSQNLYFIQAGQVTVRLEEENGKNIRLRTMGRGTVVGELGVYLGRPASASVVTNENCTILRLSLDNLKKMEATEPELAAAFHKFITRIISERLINNNKTIQALMG